MLFWLDNNENYGRELLELFSMGVGNYSEEDIKTAALAFTGWSYIQPIPRDPCGNYPTRFLFRAEEHDDSEKTFLGETGRFNGEDIIDIIVKQPATARFISRRLYDFFVADEPQVPAWNIEPPRDRITLLTQEGDVIDQWGEYGSGPGQMDHPSGIALDADENVHVVDTQNHRVQKFTRDGRFLAAWGSRGDGAGEFDMPWGIHVDELGDVYVVDWHNDRVQKFTADGEFLFQFGQSGSGDGEFNRPAGIAVDADGDIYVADEDNNRVQLFNAEGRYVEKFLGDAVMSNSARAYMLSNARELRMREMSNAPDDEKRFWSPRSVRVDGEGRMFVADYRCSRVQIYQKDAIPLDESQIWAPVRAPSLLMP